MTKMHEMTSEQLLARADDGSPGSADAIQSLQVAEIKVALRANELNEKLLDSEYATRQAADKNAEAMNRASDQLAKSTKSLKNATWALVFFTAIQAIIAVISLWKK